MISWRRVKFVSFRKCDFRKEKFGNFAFQFFCAHRMNFSMFAFCCCSTHYLLVVVVFFFTKISSLLYVMCDAMRCVSVCLCVCKFFFRFFILFCELRREYWWMHKLEQRTKNKSVRVVVDGSLVSSFCKHILIKHRAHYWNDSDNDDDDDDDHGNDYSDSGNNATTTDRMLFVALRCSCAVVFISFDENFETGKWKILHAVSLCSRMRDSHTRARQLNFLLLTVSVSASRSSSHSLAFSRYRWASMWKTHLWIVKHLSECVCMCVSVSCLCTHKYARQLRCVCMGDRLANRKINVHKCKSDRCSFTIVCGTISSMCVWVLSFSSFVLVRVRVCVYVLCGLTTIAATVYDQFFLLFLFLRSVAVYRSYATVCALFLSLWLSNDDEYTFSILFFWFLFLLVLLLFLAHKQQNVCISNENQQTALVDN